MPKIINDPVYGFITVSNPLVFSIINHPFFQRLRHIKQLGLAFVTYPGAVHTRFQHCLGALHLMQEALAQLTKKGINISPQENEAAQIAILLHDIGHGPFSHSLENVLIPNLTHEEIGLQLMHQLNQEFNGQLTEAISVFENKHPKKFLHQLVSSQLDVDRLDYLNRDSFFSGVSEGTIGSDRILKMLTVHNNELVVEEKGIYSIENFLIARRLMYWQVYLHKTVLSTEIMLTQILKRAQILSAQNTALMGSQLLLDILKTTQPTPQTFSTFAQLDDTDVWSSVKQWQQHPDPLLSHLSTRLITRKLFKLQFNTSPLNNAHLTKDLAKSLPSNIISSDYSWFVINGIATNPTYTPHAQSGIKILTKQNEIIQFHQIPQSVLYNNNNINAQKTYTCWAG